MIIRLQRELFESWQGVRQDALDLNCSSGSLAWTPATESFVWGVSCVNCPPELTICKITTLPPPPPPPPPLPHTHTNTQANATRTPHTKRQRRELDLNG